MASSNYLCVVGKFGQLAYHHAKFLSELRFLVGENAFPWTCREMLFQPSTTDLPYVFDVNVQAIARRYEDEGNQEGFLSLINVTYNWDTFGAPDGLYGKIVILEPEESAVVERTELVEKVFFALQNHIPLQEGEKIKLNLASKKLREDSSIPSSIKSFWMKITVERKGNITQHILFGARDEDKEGKKVHVFCRPGESPTYENTPRHHKPKVAPFRQVSGVVVKDGITHTYHIEPEDIGPNKEAPEEKSEIRKR